LTKIQGEIRLSLRAKYPIPPWFQNVAIERLN